MSGSARLFDSSGNLLPPDESNIKLLKSLTKNRAKSPSRRSPARNGRAGNEPKLPDFVQEITQNNESSSGRLASPTAVKVEYFNVEKSSLSTEGSPKDGKHLTRKHLDNNSTNNCKPRYYFTRFFLYLLNRSGSVFRICLSNATSCDNYVS